VYVTGSTGAGAYAYFTAFTGPGATKPALLISAINPLLTFPSCASHNPGRNTPAETKK